MNGSCPCRPFVSLLRASIGGCTSRPRRSRRREHPSEIAAQRTRQCGQRAAARTVCQCRADAGCQPQALSLSDRRVHDAARCALRAHWLPTCRNEGVWDLRKTGSGKIPRAGSTQGHHSHGPQDLWPRSDLKLVEPDREVADALAGGMVDCIGTRLRARGKSICGWRLRLESFRHAAHGDCGDCRAARGQAGQATRDQGFTVAVYRAETSANQYWMTRFNQWAQLTMMVEVSRNTQSV